MNCKIKLRKEQAKHLLMDLNMILQDNNSRLTHLSSFSKVFMEEFVKTLEQKLNDKEYFEIELIEETEND